MNRELTSILCCPLCRGELHLVLPQGNGKPLRAENTESDVVTGLLKCACGGCYPVIDGVPRLLEEGLNAFPEFTRTYRWEVEIGLSPNGSRTQRAEAEYDYIRQSFSREWGIFDYDGDKTWGWTLEERKRIFLDDMAITEDQLKGKRLLDAGCGNGTLTAALGSMGVEVVGVDLSDGLAKANRHKARLGGAHSKKVQYVQGNLFNPPLRHGSFDLVYCSGVIHHTPDTSQSFRRLVPLVREGGRLYVWVYGRRNALIRIYMDCGRRLKRFISPQSLLVACRIIAPIYKVGTEVLNSFGFMKFRERSIREITLDLFDVFAPRYNHRHTEAEVQAWFKDEGFTNITVSGRQKHGFGVYGDKTYGMIEQYRVASNAQHSYISGSPTAGIRPRTTGLTRLPKDPNSVGELTSALTSRETSPLRGTGSSTHQWRGTSTLSRILVYLSEPFAGEEAYHGISKTFLTDPDSFPIMPCCGYNVACSCDIGPIPRGILEV